jgi:hypothetical protein
MFAIATLIRVKWEQAVDFNLAKNTGQRVAFRLADNRSDAVNRWANAPLISWSDPGRPIRRAFGGDIDLLLGPLRLIYCGDGLFHPGIGA